MDGRMNGYAHTIRAPCASSVQACLAQRKLEAVVRLATLTAVPGTGRGGAAERGAAERGAAERGAAERVLLRAAGAGRLCSREAFSPFVFSWLQEACRQVRRWLKSALQVEDWEPCSAASGVGHAHTLAQLFRAAAAILCTLRRLDVMGGGQLAAAAQLVADAMCALASTCYTLAGPLSTTPPTPPFCTQVRPRAPPAARPSRRRHAGEHRPLPRPRRRGVDPCKARGRRGTAAAPAHAPHHPRGRWRPRQAWQRPWRRRRPRRPWRRLGL